MQVRKAVNQQTVDLQDKPQNIRFNLWAANIPKWVGVFDPSILPVHQYINWVKVYEYTPGRGPDGSNFTHAWTDDFDTFDANRWGAADWTFPENLVDLKPDNLTVKDGALVLSLTHADQMGFTGSVPPDLGTALSLKPLSRSPLLSKMQGRIFDLLGRGQ